MTISGFKVLIKILKNMAFVEVPVLFLRKYEAYLWCFHDYYYYTFFLHNSPKNYYKYDIFSQML